MSRTCAEFTKAFVLTLSLFLFHGTGAAAMLGVGKTCVFSSVKAHVLLNGKPVANAKVRREWNWNKPKSDESYTDKNGHVTFPAVFESSVSRLLPIELVISQVLLVQINGEDKRFWVNSKREPEENAEYGGANFDVICELNDKAVLIEDYGSLMLTVCKLRSPK